MKKYYHIYIMKCKTLVKRNVATIEGTHLEAAHTEAKRRFKCVPNEVILTQRTQTKYNGVPLFGILQPQRIKQ